MGWGIDLTEPEDIFDADELPDLVTAANRLRDMLLDFDPAGCEDCKEHQRAALEAFVNWGGDVPFTVEIDGHQYGVWQGPDRNPQ